jgi:hypothetical protein
MRRTALALVLCSVIAGSLVSADAASTTPTTYIVVLKDGLARREPR